MDFEIQISDKSGKAIAANIGEASTLIEHYHSTETIGKFPSFKAVLYGASVEDLFGVDEIKIKFTSTLKKYNATATILTKNFDIANMKLEIQGLFAPKDSILKAETRLLGKTVKEAIGALGFEQKLHLKSNVSSEFHQISETNLNALMRICDCEADIPYWTIGIQDIFLSKQVKQENYIPMSTINSFVENTNLEYEVTEENYDEVYFSAKSNTQYGIGHTENYNAIPKGLFNSYLRKLRKPDVVISGHFEAAFPYDIGTILKNTNSAWKGIKQFIVTSIVNNCTNLDFSYELQYSYFKSLD